MRECWAVTNVKGDKIGTRIGRVLARMHSGAVLLLDGRSRPSAGGGAPLTCRRDCNHGLTSRGCIETST